MGIEQIQQEMREIERDLLSVVQRFESKYGVEIVDINIERNIVIQVIGEGYEDVAKAPNEARGINLEVRINNV